jgi:hypothetical protein
MKKKINIVLIVVVLGLWGTVCYRAVNQYFLSKKLGIKTMDVNKEFKSNQINKDTFRLENSIRDPFLDKQSQSSVLAIIMSSSKTSNIRHITAPIIKSKEYINWPAISYYGYIQSKANNEELILVKINEKMHKLKINEEVEGVTLKKVYKDSIEFIFNKEKKIIQKKGTI